MKTDGATGPLGRSIIYIYSSRSKNIFIKCKCMTTISPFVGRILTTENLWCSQFPSFRFFFGFIQRFAFSWAHPMTWLFIFNFVVRSRRKKEPTEGASADEGFSRRRRETSTNSSKSTSEVIFIFCSKSTKLFP